MIPGDNTTLLAHQTWLFSVIVVELVHKSQGYSQPFCSIMQDHLTICISNTKVFFNLPAGLSALPSAQLTQLTSLSILTALSLAQQ